MILSLVVSLPVVLKATDFDLERVSCTEEAKSRSNVPLRHLVAHRESNTSTDASVRLQQRQHLSILSFDVLVQLLLADRKIMEDLFDDNLGTSLCSNGICAFQFA